MAGYYILGVDSFVNAFSLADTSKEIFFKYSKAGNNDSPLDVLGSGDQLLVYVREPVGQVNIVLDVSENKKFKKKLEVADGATITGISFFGNPEENDLIQIDESTFNSLLKRMLKFELKEDVVNENDDS